MTVTFGGYRYGGTGSGNTSISISPNSGGNGSGGLSCSTGDWMIMIFTSSSSVSNSNAPGDMSGWTVIRSFQQPNGATAFGTGVWMKRREAGDTSYA